MNSNVCDRASILRLSAPVRFSEEFTPRFISDREIKAKFEGGIN
jgi:hypothetical protein